MAISPLNKTTIQEYFPYIPEHSTWDDFNGNIAIHYGQEPIMFAPEEQWFEVASQLAELPVFATYPVPDPSLYATWQDWANEFILIINGPSQ